MTKFAFFHSKYYLHEMAELEEDIIPKRILLTAREKHGLLIIVCKEEN
jgi:hypothetical protein